jgi:poly(A) polymerase
MEEHPQARYIVETLNKAGYVAYYAGGWVRDYLLQHPSDDIDIATNASPEIIQSLFPKTVPIGLAFGIILVIVDGHEYEVATFRQDIDYKDGRRPTRVEFTSAEEDAKRRDFTINGMFYNPLTKEVLDYVGGKEDLALKVIRAIGNPHQRIQEDRLRMIRAVRLSCRFRFQIDPETERAIRHHAAELFPAVAIERIVQELEKGLAFDKLRPMLIQLHDFGLLASIFPTLKNIPLAEIQQRLEPLKHFPPKTPLIAHLLQLFPDTFPPEKLTESLKLPKTAQQFAKFLFDAAQKMKEKHLDLYEWAYFYASRFASTTLQVLAARLDPSPRTSFLAEHKSRMTRLSRSIERIERQDPLVKASDLITLGIAPGKEMGLLLKEAERIAINEQTEEKEEILKRIFLS